MTEILNSVRSTPARPLIAADPAPLSGADELITTLVEPSARRLTGRRVAVVGMGYVGLPSALSLAGAEAHVVCVDIDTTRLDAIRQRNVDLLDRDLVRLDSALTAQLLELTADARALQSAEAVIVCVPTPIDDHLTPDLRALSAACAAVVDNARAGQTLILTSTTYVGCTRDLLITPLTARGFSVGADVSVAFSPERIDPGVVDHAPDLTPRVLGGTTETCTARAADILSATAAELHTVSSPEAAEMTKLVENSFRAVNIALANEFSDVAHAMDLNVMEVIAAASTKPYGFMPFYPGPGVGGHCIPCDPHYLLWQLRTLRSRAPLVNEAMTAIAARPGVVVDRARRILGDAGLPLSGSRVLVVGVAYKSGVADLRESTAVEIIDQLRGAGAAVSFTDPMVDTLRTRHGGTLCAVGDAESRAWDLILVHTIAPEDDVAWLAERPAVLDTTYKLVDFPGRHVL
ncbi:nucleotide sugar dehydrogenase [Tomitella fengzijianii]|uniref:Nucleotide sugar dehydrogenase n=1 Tax=Tomitella fengzijianii TaxID=2597660 RepID=A0A516X6Z9_9ACTN|nr:nucleotide sugar dehydrogenase [Tomitella fengzijianii]QDQ98783.1 nucleotide sugar dehydrogenase [Tomitella fengzijianii]